MSDTCTYLLQACWLTLLHLQELASEVAGLEKQRIELEAELKKVFILRSFFLFFFHIFLKMKVKCLLTFCCCIHNPNLTFYGNRVGDWPVATKLALSLSLSLSTPRPPLSLFFFTYWAGICTSFIYPLDNWPSKTLFSSFLPWFWNFIFFIYARIFLYSTRVFWVANILFRQSVANVVNWDMWYRWISHWQ